MNNTNYTRMDREPLTNNNYDDDIKQEPRGASFWNDENAFIDNDFEPPCPFIAEHCPYPCCCCCALSRSHRQQCALTMLYNRAYLIVYLLIITMTLTLLIYDLAHGNIIHDLESEPLWFVVLDICCVGLMVFDVFVQMQAHPQTYWKSAMNVFDFVVVLLCVISVPVYFYVPDSDFILTVVLLLRFAAQLLRIVMVYKHHENRSAYMETTRDDLVDFSGFAAANDIDSAQGRSANTEHTGVSTYQNPSIQNNGSQLYDDDGHSNLNSQWDV
eukprot:792660_1